MRNETKEKKITPNLLCMIKALWNCSVLDSPLKRMIFSQKSKILNAQATKIHCVLFEIVAHFPATMVLFFFLFSLFLIWEITYDFTSFSWKHKIMRFENHPFFIKHIHTQKIKRDFNLWRVLYSIHSAIELEVSNWSFCTWNSNLISTFHSSKSSKFCFFCQMLY